MAMDLPHQHQHQHQHLENLWLSVARLPAASGFPAPWEQRHRQEFALRDGLFSTNKQHNSNRHYHSKDGKSNKDPNLEPLNSDLPQAQEPAFQLTSIREAELVSRCLYALQGIPVAVTGLQLLAKLFSGQVADRSLHRLPSLWQRSSSSKALGKLLTIIVQAGWVRCQLEEFVQFFLKPQRQGAVIDQLYTKSEMQPQLIDSRQRKKGRQKTKHQQKVTAAKEEELRQSPPYSLVNQAFAKSVKTILQGHLVALNALTDSVLHRRSTDGSQTFNSACLDERVGAVIGLPSCDLTLLELHLHTSTLRTQLQALASICFCKTKAENFGMQEEDEHEGWPMERDSAAIEKSPASTVLDFKSFPRGADLLSFLYRRLQEADSVHVELLQYLFSCACQPYLVFVHSWLYQPTVKDPFKEFIVDEAVAMAGSGSQVPRKEHSLIDLKEQALVSVPCFLEDVCTPLIRAGQQLQVLLKLVETGVADATYNTTSCFLDGFRMLESALKGWTELASENSVFSPILIFNKQKLDELVEERQRRRHDLMQDFDLLFSNLHLQSEGSEIWEGSNVLELRQVNAQSVACDTDPTVPEGLNVQGMSRDLRCYIGNRDLKEVEELQDHKNILMPLETFSECLSLSGLGEEACEVHEKEDETHDNEIDIPGKKEMAEPDQSVGIQAEKDQPFTPECNRASKQRKRWIDPLEVVVLHGQAEEEVSSVHNVAEDKMYLCRCMPFVCEHEDEAEVDTLCSRISGNDYLDLSISRGVPSHAYNLPALSQASPWLEAELKSGVGGPALQTLALARSHGSNGFSFFFPDICLEELGPDFFGRSYIHKLAQNYKNSSLPQSDSYKNNGINFDVVSQKFWSFEDCVCNGSFDMKLLPAFSFTNVSTALETLSLDNKNVDSLCTEVKNEVRTENAEGHPYQSNKRKVSSNFSATCGVCNFNPTGSQIDNTVKFQDEIPIERAEEDMRVEVTTKDLQKNKGSACGGATWQSYLTLKGPEATRSKGAALKSSEIPLEVIVDKCVIQEVLSQYQCISHFSVRLLHKVFNLQDHLAALKRYFFMERGDWADMFTNALYHHAWYPTGSQQRQLEVQTLLEAAIQNSSCQEDVYAERLYVSVETKCEHIQSVTDDLVHIYINKNSLSAFDFITLGYHMEWPISLIITSESFKLYNSIFSFLVRAKLAVHALGDIWRYLKDLLHVPKKGNTQAKQDWINILMLFRQQIAHFITTLQGHIESQLLHNVWCRFLQALHHEGKDLQYLETLHGLYLKDALHVCFLSDEMKPVKTCADDIMQCLLDLSSCLNIFGKQENGKPSLESEKVQSAILEAKNRFKLVIQQLHQIALNSHDQLSLNQFWTCLDFNGYFGDMCLRI